MAGIKVIGGFDRTGVKRVLIALLEKELKFELLRIIDDDNHESVIYLQPLENEYVKFEESRIITDHIATFYRNEGNNLIPLGDDSGKLVEALKIESKEFDPVASKLVFEQIYKRPNIIVAQEDAKLAKTVVAQEEAKLAKIFDKFENMLNTTKYLASDRFTLVDLNAIPMIHYLLKTPTKRLFNKYKRVKEWAEDIISRPSAKEVLN